MIRFRFDPEQDEEFPFQHFTLEGDNAAGFVLLGYDDAPKAQKQEFSEEADFDEREEEQVFQRWFETLGQALATAEDELGIPRTVWAAPIMKSHSGRLQPPMPHAPQQKPSTDERPIPRIGTPPPAPPNQTSDAAEPERES
jgi:hypothetical protein